MSVLPPVPRPNISTGGSLTPPWQSWFSVLASIVRPTGQSGATADRPGKGLYVGLSFFDTTLGKPVFVSVAGPPAVWVDATGTVV